MLINIHSFLLHQNNIVNLITILNKMKRGREDNSSW